MEPPQKRQRLSPVRETQSIADDDLESTDLKLALLASLHPDRDQQILLDYLLAYDGSVESASTALSGGIRPEARKRTIGYQSSLNFGTNGESKSARRPLTKKGRTLHLYSPEDVEAHTPCTLIHNFLPVEIAEAVLKELMEEVSTFTKDKFHLFEREVESPHTSRFYVDTWDELEQHKSEYMYNGGVVQDVGKTPPQLLRVSGIVRRTVNTKIKRRIAERSTDGKKLKYQAPEEWQPNVSFVNCYAGGKESVGWHTDSLSYLGPRAVIGSLSLGVAREFRVRKIVPQVNAGSADEQGQISISLPHNSLLIMHADMQEEWKHCVAPATSIDPHPIAGNRRLNVTYRCYKDYLHPKHTPRCRCDLPAVLRCVQKRAVTRGRYMWMCQSATPCGWFVWAELDEDGKPQWATGFKGNVNLPLQMSASAESPALTLPPAANIDT